MRINKLHTICTMTLAAILFVGFEASASNWEMEAGAGCMDEACMFGSQTLAQNSGVAQLHKINVFSIDGKDPREAQDRAAEAVRALAPIGIVTNNNPVPTKNGHSAKGRATSFMVSPCFAFVNHHAAFGKETNPDENADHSMTMKVGVGAQGGFAYELKATPVRAGDMNRADASDWTLVKVEKCPGRKTGWMETAALDLFKFAGTKVSMAGFPADKNVEQISFQKTCTLQGLNAGTGNIEHDCGSRAGASGSPLFAMVDGKPVVVAMHVGADTDKEGVLKSYSPADANQAVPMNILKDNPEVFKLIQEDIKLWGQPNPALQKSAAKAQTPSVA